MKVTGDWLNAESVQTVLGVLANGGHAAFAVGGCVRNDIMGAPIADIDIATSAAPNDVIRLAGDAGLRTIATGLEHGTITVVAGPDAFEVTTFRKDVATDGRRAVVAFSDRLEDDAARRDFTMNALYADRAGAIHDPVGGYQDAIDRRVIFVGDGHRRVKEDYLRILRFFRFYAWYGDPARGPDPDALNACAANIDGLNRLSAERIGAEMIKLLAAPNPAPSIALMEQAGVLPAILPGASAKALPILVHVEKDAASDPLRRLAALGGQEVGDRLRLSRKQADRLERMTTGATSGVGAGELGYRDGRDLGMNVLLLRAAMFETEVNPEDVDRLAQGADATFPLQASDLMPAFEGAALGRALKNAETHWIGRGFKPGRDELLEWLRGHDPSH